MIKLQIMLMVFGIRIPFYTHRRITEIFHIARKPTATPWDRYKLCVPTPATLSPGTNSSDSEFTQYLNPVGRGPSSNTWPR